MCRMAQHPEELRLRLISSGCELAERALAGKLSPDEFSGGTLRSATWGCTASTHFTAVINPPEAAIHAVGAATEEAVVRAGQVLAATTMKLTLSIEHRVLDGATAAAFLRDLAQMLEEPLRIVVILEAAALGNSRDTKGLVRSVARSAYDPITLAGLAIGLFFHGLYCLLEARYRELTRGR